MKKDQSPQTYITVKGAREHNLKNIDVKIPRDKLVVITGLSGSGKSSLAFDTIYAEGQRRYVESLSSYARQFLGQMDKPDVDVIEGLSPAISIEQKSTSRNPRSTVGTITEIYDYLRLLYARAGTPHCPKCGDIIKRQTPQQIVDRILSFDEGTKFMVLAPIVRGRKGTYDSLLEDMKKQGFSRARIDGEIIELDDDINLERYEQHTIEIVVDRLIVKEGIERPLTESQETALNLADGVMEILMMDGDETLTFSEHLACGSCGISYDELAPRNFSFNSPFGACNTCDGLGYKYQVDAELVVPNEDISLLEGAIAPWATRTTASYMSNIFNALSEEIDFDVNKPWNKLPKKIRDVLLNGHPKKLVVNYTSKRGLSRQYNTKYEGIIPWVKRRYSDTDSDRARSYYEGYMREQACNKCGGARLAPLPLNVKIADKSIAEVGDFSISDVSDFFLSVTSGDKIEALTEKNKVIAEPILKEVNERLQFLTDVGLGYLSLNRSSGTLSGGEAQRIRLASQIGSGLVGVLYVLDEPSIGLHQRDNKKLIATLMRLKKLGNTVLVVEHDEESIMVADNVIDIGPRAGIHGGHLVAQGTIEDIKKSKKSLTGKYLSGELKISIPTKRREGNGNYISIIQASVNNLNNVNVDIPLGLMVGVSGVSGSGKSSLINQVLLKGLMKKLYKSKAVPGKHKAIEGLDHIDKVISIDQSPIGRTPRSNPATYTGVFDKIRKLYSQTPEAKIRGYSQGRFSFNVKGGRCEDCSGDGTIKIEMHFLPDVYVPCEVCEGKRYNRDTLDILYKGKNIAELLETSIEDACKFFENQPTIKKHLDTLVDVGLGYITLGQSATTLSGGEAQRVKLASELCKRSTGKTLYVLDEPTTGLHFDDVNKLLHVLHQLADSGNTVLVIEHNLDVLRNMDWIIDLGPDGGSGGGEIVAEGTPEQVKKVKNSFTGQYL